MIARLFFAAALVATPAVAQIMPVADVAGYQVARIGSQNVCFAVTELESEGGAGVIYGYYTNKTGQRWHTLSFSTEGDVLNGPLPVTVTIDGDVTLERDTVAQNGDFMLPFEVRAEIEGHEAMVAEGDEMVVSIRGGEDALRVDLDDYRAALGAIDTCLSAI